MEGNDDDQQPMKPTIDYNQQQLEGSQPIELPQVESKHRQVGVVGNKKQSVNIVSDNRLLNENDSQNSNSYGQLPRNESIGTIGMSKGQGGLSQPRGSVGPRVISKVRGEKVMHVYQNANNK